MLFEEYRMALDWEKYGIEVWNDDEIKRNQILFDFMYLTFNCLDGLNFNEIFILINMIIKDQSRKQIAAEIEKLDREKKARRE